jgi:type IV pilus assembly protein PilA
MEFEHWFYARDGTQLGPVSHAQLVEAIRSGECGPDDLVWHEGMPDWQPASTVPGLFPNPSPQPPAEAAELQPPAAPIEIAPAPYAVPGASQIGYAQPVQGSHNGLAIAAFVCSVCGLTLTCCISVFSVALSITGLCLAIAAKRGMQRTGSDQGRGFATAAIVISIVHLALCAGLIVVYAFVLLSHR